MSPIRAVFLDAGGVLVLPSRERVRDALATVGAAADDATIDTAHYHAMHAFDEAGPDERDRVAAYRRTYAAAVTGLPAAPARLGEALDRVFDGRGNWIQAAPGARSTLTALTGRGLPVVIVSNTTHGDVAEQLARAAVCQVGTGDAAPVTEIVDSTVVGRHKPDPGIFAIALRAAGSAAGETIHVGDSVATDVAGARAAGIAAWHLDPLGLCPDDQHPHLRRLAELVELVAAAS